MTSGYDFPHSPPADRARRTRAKDRLQYLGNCASAWQLRPALRVTGRYLITRAKSVSSMIFTGTEAGSGLSVVPRKPVFLGNTTKTPGTGAGSIASNRSYLDAAFLPDWAPPDSVAVSPRNHSTLPGRGRQAVRSLWGGRPRPRPAPRSACRPKAGRTVSGHTETCASAGTAGSRVRNRAAGRNGARQCVAGRAFRARCVPSHP
jgi:hypothetical protein